MQQRTFSSSRWRNDRHHLTFEQFQVGIGQYRQTILRLDINFPQIPAFQDNASQILAFRVMKRSS